MKLIPLALSLLLIAGGGASASAQEAAPLPQKNDCTPRLRSEGPWKCTYEIKRVACPAQMDGKPSDLWKTVDGEEQAKELLRAKYAQIKNLVTFSQWLACQGFLVQSNPHPPPTAYELLFEKQKGARTSISLTLYYHPREKPIFENSVLGSARPYSADFILQFDDHGHLVRIRHSLNWL